MTTKFLLLSAVSIQEYKDNSGEKRFNDIRDRINTSNNTTAYLLRLLANFSKPTMNNIVEHIEENIDFSLFNTEDKKITATILIYRYYKEINLELNIASDDYLSETLSDCTSYYSINKPKSPIQKPKSKAKEIKIKEEKSPMYFIFGLIILIISIYFAQDQSRLNEMKGNLVGLGVLIGVVMTFAGLVYYKTE
jgi:hypothetical protein